MLLASSSDTILTVAGIVGIILGVLGSLGAAIAIFRSNLANSTITLLKQNNDALKERVDELQKNNEEQRLKLAQQETAITTLQDTVSGVKAIELVTSKLDQYHADVLALVKGGNAGG